MDGDDTIPENLERPCSILFCRPKVVSQVFKNLVNDWACLRLPACLVNILESVLFLVGIARNPLSLEFAPPKFM